MTEKAKLTREQADAVDSLLGNLQGMRFTELFKAIQYGYDVEPEYKVGDWKKVALQNGRWAIGQVDTTAFEDIIFNYLGVDNVWRRVRQPGKASVDPTPEEIKVEKERRLWKEIGREVGEFRNGDIGVTNGGAESKIHHPNNIKAIYKDDCLKGFYPAESFISFENGDANA